MKKQQPIYRVDITNSIKNLDVGEYVEFENEKHGVIRNLITRLHNEFEARWECNKLKNGFIKVKRTE